MTGRRGVAIVLAVYLFFGFGYSLLMPLWEAPDERAHYGYALSIARKGEPPTVEQNYESFQPPLYYQIAALPIRLIAAIEPAWITPLLPPRLPVVEGTPRYDWNTGNYEFLLAPLVLRWIGVIIGAVSLVVIYLGVSRVFPGEKGPALGTIALIGGIPQFIHITASVNNDILAILAGALLFFGLAVVLRQETIAWPWFAVLAAGVIFPIVVKLTVLPLGLTAAAAVVYRIRQLRPELSARFLAVSAGLFASGFLLLLVFSPSSIHRLAIELQFRLLTVRSGIWDDSILRIVGRYLWNFWGKVGWLSVGIPLPAALALSALAATGFGFALRALVLSNGHADTPLAEKRLLVFSLFAVGAAGVMIFRNFFTSPQLQGRFLFPTLGPIALLIVFGWRRLLADRARVLVPAIVILFALLNLHLWITGVIPVYFQPFLDR